MKPGSILRWFKGTGRRSARGSLPAGQPYIVIKQNIHDLLLYDVVEGDLFSISNELINLNLKFRLVEIS